MIQEKTPYQKWRNDIWKLSWKRLKGLNKRQDRVRHRLAFKIRKAISESYSEY